MASSSSSRLPENALLITTKQEALIEELVHGRDLATQLRAILSKTDLSEDNNGGDTAEDLVSKIMRSFTTTLVMLEKNDNNNTYTNTNTSTTTTIATNCNENDSRFLVGPSQCLDHNGPKSEDSEESCKSVSTVVVTQKDRRGCYKRRKTLNSWTRDTPTLIDDGFAWRKYGQKPILKSKHPRNYFRCTHKYDQKCMATKHVQKIQEEPPMYRTTYFSNHTCGNLQTAPELVLDCSSSPTHENSNNNSTLLSFNPASKHSQHPFFSTLKHVKQEFKDIVPYCNNNEEDNDNDNNNNNNNVIAINDMTNNDHQNISGFDHHHDDQISSNLWDMESFEDDVLKHMNFN